MLVAWCFFIGAIFVTALSLILELDTWKSLDLVDLKTWGSVLYAAFIGSAFAYGYVPCSMWQCGLQSH